MAVMSDERAIRGMQSAQGHTDAALAIGSTNPENPVGVPNPATEIVNDDMRAFIAAHRHENVTGLALKAKRTDLFDMPTALDQIEGWQIAGKKLPQWAACDGIIYPPHISMEQCSSQFTALYKAEIAHRLLCGAGTDTVPESSMVDLTGGFGVDFSFLAREFARATYVERQARLCAIAAHNMAELGLSHARIVQGDGVEYLRAMRPTTMIYIDPARRDEHGARTYAIADCTPNVLTLRDLLLAKARFTLIKLSPMLDWRKAVADFGGAVREVHIVSTGNECKELLLVLAADGGAHAENGANTAAAVSVEGMIGVDRADGADGAERAGSADGADGAERANDVDGVDGAGSVDGVDSVWSAHAMIAGRTAKSVSADASSFAVDCGFAPHVYCVNDGQRIDYDAAVYTRGLRIGTAPLPPVRFLYEPNASIMKAGCFDLIEERFGVTQIGPSSHLFVSDTAIADFPGRGFVVEAMGGMGKKEVRRLLNGTKRANIAVRNFPLTAPQLRKKLKLADGGDVYLFGTTMQGGEHMLIRTKKLA